MTRLMDERMVEPAIRALLGVADVDGGRTAEQDAVLRALLSALWPHLELDLGALEPLDPAGAAAAITHPRDRRRLRELMVLLELCRHPLADAQVARVDEYAVAIEESGAGIDLARDLVRDGAQVAAADYARYLGSLGTGLVERSLRDTRLAGDLDAPDPELAARLRALHDLPARTLGYEYVEFYRRNGLELPGDDVHMPGVFVSHDMCHVIGGYEPTGQGEIALGAMQLGITDTDAHWVAFLGNLGVHEAGYLGAGHLVPKEGTLTRSGAPEMVADALWRGTQCTGDFTTADHLSMVELPLAEVRERFGVPPVDAPR